MNIPIVSSGMVISDYLHVTVITKLCLMLTAFIVQNAEVGNSYIIIKRPSITKIPHTNSIKHI